MKSSAGEEAWKCLPEDTFGSLWAEAQNTLPYTSPNPAVQMVHLKVMSYGSGEDNHALAAMSVF